MNTITDKAYTALTIPQRIAATISAMSREDAAEVTRLKSTSNAGEFVMSKVSARINDLRIMGMTIHADLTTAVASFFLAQTFLVEEDTSEEGTRIGLVGMNNALKEAASIIAARNEWLADIGIDPAEFIKATGPGHYYHDMIATRSDGHACPDYTAKYRAAIGEFFQDRYPS